MNFIMCSYMMNSFTLTYMEGTQLQHPHDAHSCEHQFLCGCISAEKTLFQCISHHPEILDHSLVQIEPERRQRLLKKAKIMFYCTRTTPPFIYLYVSYMCILKPIAGHCHSFPSRPINRVQTVGCICMLFNKVPNATLSI